MKTTRSPARIKTRFLASTSVADECFRFLATRPGPMLDDPAHGDAMKAQRIWPVGRSPDFWGVSEISVSRKGIIQRSELTDELDAAHATEWL